MSQPILHQHTIADEAADRWLYVLHGIYGAGRNWASLARRVLDGRPGWGAVLVDLRLHGHSLGFDPPHTLAACVHDVIELSAALERPVDAVLGHSFGGKVALMLSEAVAPEQVWVIDSTPSRRTPGGSAARMLQMVRRLPERFDERRDAVAVLEAAGLASHVAHWMATNVVPASPPEVGYRWRFDWDEVEALLADFFRRDLWDVIEAPAPTAHIHLVRADESDVMTPAELERARAAGTNGRVFTHELHGGHWLHVDNPDALVGLVTAHLP